MATRAHACAPGSEQGDGETVERPDSSVLRALSSALLTLALGAAALGAVLLAPLVLVLVAGLGLAVLRARPALTGARPLPGGW
ncbi:hypothetical protein [Nocardioides acrostichi]|uniref:Uncharacterized protein n=1 Tax=Nocardioides acrostichi TaxID=2784339 RepID=A0A930Y7V6_9ACTN|nr:hypothetical protein [Nocardioides acrostichi]MBF4162442.1 hypothetical protein [Nocardioides acrostichi]